MSGLLAHSSGYQHHCRATPAVEPDFRNGMFVCKTASSKHVCLQNNPRICTPKTARDTLTNLLLLLKKTRPYLQSWETNPSMPQQQGSPLVIIEKLIKGTANDSPLGNVRTHSKKTSSTQTHCGLSRENATHQNPQMHSRTLQQLRSIKKRSKTQKGRHKERRN